MTVVRNATTSDIPAVLELLHDLGRPDPADAADAERFAAIASSYVADLDKAVLVAESGGRIMGLASVIFLIRLNRPGPEMYIPELVTRADCRGQGVGRALIEACVELAGRKECHRIRLESGNRRHGSHSFYRRLGFGQSALSFDLQISG